MSENGTNNTQNTSNGNDKKSKSKDSTDSFKQPKNKYQNISTEDNQLKEFIESLPFQANLLSDSPVILSQDDRIKAVYKIFTDTIVRNLPDIDPNIAKTLVHATVEEILPLIFKASEEIKHRYQDTGKFEGYEHPEIKEIIEKHLLSSHRNFQSGLVKSMKMFGTPLHELFGKQKYAEGESATVAKNVHTLISRTGNIVACCLFIEGMAAVTNPLLAVASSVLLYTGLQILNEYTNEVEHSTVDKRNAAKKVTKWVMILGAKSIPIIMTALSVAALETPNLQERYLKNEGIKLHEQITERGKNIEKSPSRIKQQSDFNKLKDIVKDLEAKRQNASGNSYNDIVRRLEGLSNGNPTVDETAARPRLKALEKTIKDENKEIENSQKKFDDDWISLGEVGFFQKYADMFLGADSDSGKEFKKRIQKYSELPSGTRFENGLGHMGEVLFKGKFNDEILLRIWVAILFESLSIITLLAVQSRADFKKVVTNSDEDKRLNSPNTNSEPGDSTRFNEDYKTYKDCIKNVEFDSVNPSSKSWEKLWNYFIIKKIDNITTDKDKYRHEPPSYSSLVNSVAIQKAIAELFREGHMPVFNQIIGDIARGLIHPIPLDTEAIERLENAKKSKDKTSNGKDEALVELFKHDEKLEGDTRYLLNIPRRMIRSLQENILSNDKSSLSTEALAVNLSRILLNETPEKEVNNQLLLDELKNTGKKESYLKLIKSLQDLNSDVQDVVDNYGSTKDRLDLKNNFKDKIRNIIKEFETNEQYNNADETTLIDLAKTLEIKEANSSINYIRMDTAVSYIKELTTRNRITPVLLNQIIEGLKIGNAVVISEKERNKKLFQKIRDLRLSSPYQSSIEACIYEMQKLSTDFVIVKIGWFTGRRKLAEFKAQLVKTILKYEIESYQEKLKLKNN